MSGDVEIEFGTSAEDLGWQFVEAWEAAERGEACEPHRVLVFHDFETLLSVLSSPRLRLLKHLAREPAPRSAPSPEASAGITGAFMRT